MRLQCDIIPTTGVPNTYCDFEDGIPLADRTLLGDLDIRLPKWANELSTPKRAVALDEVQRLAFATGGRDASPST